MAKTSYASNSKPKKSAEDFLEQHAGQGFDNLTAEDRAIPFLRVLQPLSPQLQEDDPAHIPGAKAGQFFNTVTQQVYGLEINLIPLRFQKVWLEWAPDRGGLVNRHAPGSIPVDKTNFSKWKYNGNVIQETFMFYCLIEGHLEEGPILFALQSTGIKHAKNWNTNIIMKHLPSGSQAPYFSGVWTLKTEKYKNDKGSYYQIGGNTSNIEFQRFITEEEYAKFVAPCYSEIKLLEQRVDFVQLSDSSEDDGEEVAY